MNTAQNPMLAAALTLIASAFVAGSLSMAKLLGNDILGPALHPLQVSQGRFVFALGFLLIGVAILRPRFRNIRWRTHAVRSSFGWGGVTLMFAAAAYIPLSDATAISFLNPVIAMLLAVPFLGERIGPWRALAAVVAVAGALVLMRPTPEAFQAASLLAVASALCLGAELIVIKRLTNAEAPFQILVINNLIGMCIASLAASFVWQMPTPAQWLALVATGVLMCMAQICFINAIRRADASFVSPFFYATLVFAVLYDFAIFSVIPDAVSLVGAVTIIAGAALLAWRESRIKPSIGSPS